MYHFTTFFDRNYLSRGLALYDSLKENCGEFVLYILCLDSYTESFFKARHATFPEVIVLGIEQIEQDDPELRECKSNRSLIEYYFTLSPCLPLYIVKKYQLPHICSLDADILFLNTPRRLFDYLEEHSIVITPHKFSPELRHLEKYGRFNVSFQIFRNDPIGTACLEEWRRQCIDWCYDYLDVEHGRFADQRYLDEWPARYGAALIELNDSTSGLAAWNLNNYQIKNSGGRFYSNGQLIEFYHFHHFKFISANLGLNGFHGYRVKAQRAVDRLYAFYWQKIEMINRRLQNLGDISIRSARKPKILQVLHENTLYLKIGTRVFAKLNFSWVPGIIKRAIEKIYA